MPRLKFRLPPSAVAALLVLAALSATACGPTSSSGAASTATSASPAATALPSSAYSEGWADALTMTVTGPKFVQLGATETVTVAITNHSGTNEDTRGLAIGLDEAADSVPATIVSPTPTESSSGDHQWWTVPGPIKAHKTATYKLTIKVPSAIRGAGSQLCWDGTLAMFDTPPSPLAWTEPARGPPACAAISR